MKFKLQKRSKTTALKTAKGLRAIAGMPQALHAAYEGGKAARVGKGVVIDGAEGGGARVMPVRRSSAPVTEDKPLQHRPCVIEEKTSKEKY